MLDMYLNLTTLRRLNMNDRTKNQNKWHLYAQPEVLPATVVIAPLLLMLVAAYFIA